LVKLGALHDGTLAVRKASEVFAEQHLAFAGRFQRRRKRGRVAARCQDALRAKSAA
jgi:hypothetical protein